MFLDDFVMAGIIGRESHVRKKSQEENEEVGKLMKWLGRVVDDPPESSTILPSRWRSSRVVSLEKPQNRGRLGRVIHDSAEQFYSVKCPVGPRQEMGRGLQFIFKSTFRLEDRISHKLFWARRTAALRGEIRFCYFSTFRHSDCKNDFYLYEFGFHYYDWLNPYAWLNGLND